MALFKCFPGFLSNDDSGFPYTQTPGRIQKVDPRSMLPRVPNLYLLGSQRGTLHMLGLLQNRTTQRYVALLAACKGRRICCTLLGSM